MDIRHRVVGWQYRTQTGDRQDVVRLILFYECDRHVIDRVRKTHILATTDERILAVLRLVICAIALQIAARNSDEAVFCTAGATSNLLHVLTRLCFDLFGVDVFDDHSLAKLVSVNNFGDM